ncbi:MAG: two-component system response regulator [Rhodoferax sp.]|nr:two-component system response regulator [Rhodoferax sp.]MCF8211190.1 two-component system response regulator [Rhodoferax sp.]
MDLFPSVNPTILVVDDAPANLSLISGLLRDSYTVKAANHGTKALKIACEEKPDLILLDILMPDMDGYEVCRRLKANPQTSHIPVIFLTSKSDIESEQLGMSLGAVDYVTRPISPPILLSRVKAHLVEAFHARTLQVNNEYLEYEVSKRSRQLLALQDVTTLALASLAETRDADTGNHLRRTQHYVQALARQLKEHPRFGEYLTENRIQALFKCAPLHDIGKVGIPDRVLLKPGRFEPSEWEVMKQHPTLGHEALANAQSNAEANSEFLEIAKEIVYSHHEKWDGSGYPQGLAGDDIPIAARLMAVADVYDALISRRIYKKAAPHAQAVQIIKEGRGTHFDPDMVDTFCSLSDEFRAIAERFADTDEDLLEKAKLLKAMATVGQSTRP